MARRPPPRKQQNVPTGPRRIAGEVLDVTTQAQRLGESEKQLRAQVARGLIPHRKLGGRIIFIAEECREFFRQLPGVTMEQALANLAARSGREGAR
jgi:hypothetical protein